MRIFIALYIVSIAFAVSHSLAQTPITIYSEAGQRPFSYEENGVPRGSYVENLQRVLKKIPGYEVRIKFASWARAVEEAKNGNSAGVLGVYYRPDERPFLNHSQSIFKEDVAVHCNRDSVKDRQFSNYPEDFSGMKFGNQRGYLAPGPRFFEFAKEGRIAIVEGLEFAGLVRKMLVGEIDCVINPSLVLDEALNTLEANGLPERMRYKSKRIMTVKTETVHVGFSKKYEDSHPEFRKFRLLFDQAAKD